MAFTDSLSQDFVHLARLSLAGQQEDVHVFLKRMCRRYRDSTPQLAEEISSILKAAPSRTSPLRREITSPLPVDSDSRLELLRVEDVPTVPLKPIFRKSVAVGLDQIIQEHKNIDELLEAGLNPTRSLLFTGPPGVGKTMAARWIALKIGVPLFTLDLAAVMSSFLGRTGNNVRHVLDYAKQSRCVLLLDEFDAIAKRRDDQSEIGELKRLVTVLLQEIDQWPSTGLLIAATNHADLLDPAVWRRFEQRIDFPIPDRAETYAAISQLVSGDVIDDALLPVLAIQFEGKTFSEIERLINLARRTAVMQRASLNDGLLSAIKEHIECVPRKARRELAIKLSQSSNLSQREIQSLTGVSRDTIRKSSSIKPLASKSHAR